MDIVKFYEVEFTNKLGHSVYRNVVGAYSTINDWAIKEASADGLTYNIRYLCTETLNGIKNLTNY